MNRLFVRFALVLALAASTLAQTGTAAPAQPTNPATAGSNRVGLFMFETAIMNTNEGIRDFGAIDKEFEPRSAKLDAQGKEIQTLETQLSTQGDKMNEEARAKLARDIDAKKKIYQRDVEDARAAYQEKRNEVAERIIGKLKPLLDQYAKANGFALILDPTNPNSGVVWANLPAVDVTRQIVEAYNLVSGVPAPAPQVGGAPAQQRPSAPSATRPTTPATRPPANQPK